MPLAPKREGIDPDTKVCNACHIELPIAEFRLVYKLRTKAKVRRLYRYHQCKECHNHNMNFPKKKYKAKRDISRAIGDIDKRVVIQAVTEDPELMKLVIGRMGQQRFERMKASLINVILIESLEHRVRYNNYRGRSIPESLKVWEQAVTELGYPIPTRLIDYAKLGLVEKDDRKWQ